MRQADVPDVVSIEGDIKTTYTPMAIAIVYVIFIFTLAMYL